MREQYSISLGETAHSHTKDSIFKGYKFSASTKLTCNHWAICHNPKEFPQPERFWPDRFLMTICIN